MNRLFDPGPVTKHHKLDNSASKINRGSPIWAVMVGTTTEYVRACDEVDARDTWRNQRHHRLLGSVPDTDIGVKVMRHADLERLREMDPKVWRRLRST